MQTWMTVHDHLTSDIQYSLNGGLPHEPVASLPSNATTPLLHTANLSQILGFQIVVAVKESSYKIAGIFNIARTQRSLFQE